MVKKLRAVLTVFLAILLLSTLGLTALAAADGDGAQQEAGEEMQSTPEPEQPAAETPALPQPVIPQPVVTEAPTPVPTAAPVQPAATEAAGTVNLHLYVVTTDGVPAAGYTVAMGDARTTTNGSGLADFSGLPVAQQQVRITSPGGDTCVGRLYMSRSAATGVTEQAMGGTYGVDVARGQDELYMVVTFAPGDAISIRTLSNSQPAMPTQAAPAETSADTAAEAAAPSGTSYRVKALTAIFLDESGDPIAGMTVAVTTADGSQAALTTSAAGAINVPNAPYGSYRISAAAPGREPAVFDLTINPGVRTAVAQNAGASMVVEAATTSDHLYLQFTQTATGFVLTEASDTPIGSDYTSLVVGIIVVVAIVVIVMILVVRLRRRGPAKQKGATVPVRGQRKVNYDPTQAAAPEDTQPKRTGGANKFDDRSKM